MGTNMITGDAVLYKTNHLKDINGHMVYDVYDEYNPNTYRMGTFYIGTGSFRIRRDSEGIRKTFQNQFAHDFLTGGGSKWFEVLSLKPRGYWRYGYSSGYTLW